MNRMGVDCLLRISMMKSSKKDLQQTGRIQDLVVLRFRGDQPVSWAKWGNCAGFT